MAIIAARIRLRIRCWLRTAVRLRAQSELAFVVQHDEACAECRSTACFETGPTDDATSRCTSAAGHDASVK